MGHTYHCSASHVERYRKHIGDFRGLGREFRKQGLDSYIRFRLIKTKFDPFWTSLIQKEKNSSRGVLGEIKQRR